MAQLFIQMSYTIGILLGALIFLQALPRREYFALRFSAGVAISLIAGWMFSYLSPPLFMPSPAVPLHYSLSFFFTIIFASRRNTAFFLHMHEEERRQYELSKETAEVLSIKYHDLKHQLVALEGKLPQNEIHSIHKILDTYDSIYHTGNEALDIIPERKNPAMPGKKHILHLLWFWKMPCFFGHIGCVFPIRQPAGECHCRNGTT